jgi:hypothetical protein
MSDPVTNFDIEDVLSSIRRLVREGAGDVSMPTSAARPKERGDDSGPADEPTATPTRFVLTQALRVVEGSDNVSKADGEVPMEDELARARVLLARTEAGRQPDKGFEFTVAEIVAAEVSPEKSEDEAPFVAVEPTHRVADTAAGLEAALSDAAGEWEPDGSENTPVMDWAQTTPEDAPVFRSRLTAQSVVHSTVAESSGTRVTEFSMRQSAADTYSVLPEAEVSDIDEIVDDAQTTGSGGRLRDDLTLLPGGEILADEAALRALIAEIVRQELQGSLGERITRNVRKLVRQEINRMMTSESFE